MLKILVNWLNYLSTEWFKIKNQVCVFALFNLLRPWRQAKAMVKPLSRHVSFTYHIHFQHVATWENWRECRITSNALYVAIAKCGTYGRILCTRVRVHARIRSRTRVARTHVKNLIQNAAKHGLILLWTYPYEGVCAENTRFNMRLYPRG